MDGYTLYLPVSFDERTEKIPVLVYLQGSFGVGGPIGDLNHWGLPRLLRDEHDLSTERNRLLLDGFVVVSPHIQEGQYHDHPEVVQGILERVFREFKGDPDRVVLTGLSRGGHGTWGLADRLPDTFAAIVPIGGEPFMVEDFTKLARPAVWIAHNVGDSVASFGEAVSASRRIEAASGVDFLRLDRIDVTGTDYLDRRYVFSAPRRAGHDAWTDLYTSAAFYRWLLQQSRRGPLAVPADSSGRGTLFERLSEDRDS